MGKKLLLFWVGLLCGCLSVFAVDAEAYSRPVSRGYRASGRIASRFYIPEQYCGMRFGYNLSSLSLRGCTGAEGDPISGLNVGMVYGINIAYDEPVFFETGLLYSGKGARLHNGADRYSIRMHTLEVPFVLKYIVATDVPGFSVQPFAGGFASVGVGGNYKDFQHREKHMTFHKGSFQSFDLGFRVGCSFQYQMLTAELSYDFGMCNMASSDAYNLAEHLNYDDFDDKIRTGNLSLTIGVNF